MRSSPSLSLAEAGLSEEIMGWFHYYRLLEEYEGDWTRVPHEAKLVAANYNPDSPAAAFALARRKYDEAHPNV